MSPFTTLIMTLFLLLDALRDFHKSFPAASLSYGKPAKRSMRMR